VPEWLVETERIGGVTKVFDRDDLLKVKCLAVWLRFSIEIQTICLETESLQEFNTTTWNEKTP
jgi:hypothetical protein